METQIFYALLTVQNPYSSGNRGIEHGWYTNYESGEMTKKEFTAVAKRVAKNLAERKFYDTLKNGERVQVFTDWAKFAAAYEKATGYKPKNPAG